MGSLWDGEICRSSAAIARIALIAVAGCAGPAKTPAPPPQPITNVAEPVTAPEPQEMGDPARIEGRWAYRTSSNCGTVEGTGSVEFEWDDMAGAYRETGYVSWPLEASSIRWWGTARFEPIDRRLVADIENSLGDRVLGNWEIEGDPPWRLVVDWEQTNGCTGRGVATRD